MRGLDKSSLIRYLLTTMTDFDKAIANFKNADVADFGKVMFVSRNHTVPALPDMNLIVFKKEYGYQAVCINIEVDAVGSSLKEACGNLETALRAYIAEMANNHDGSLNAAVTDIVNTAYREGTLKSVFFSRYLQEKHRYLVDKITKKSKAKSRMEEAINGLRKAFQIRPVRVKLTLAATVL